MFESWKINWYKYKIQYLKLLLHIDNISEDRAVLVNKRSIHSYVHISIYLAVYKPEAYTFNINE